MSIDVLSDKSSVELGGMGEAGESLLFPASIKPFMERASERSELVYPAFSPSTIWDLPGKAPEKTKPNCGEFYKVACLHVEEHKDHQAYFEKRRVSCHRPDCPVCFRSWALREAKRIEHRISHFKLGGLKWPIHFMVSPPKALWTLSVDKLKKRAYGAAREVGFLGGSCIYHPYRSEKELPRNSRKEIKTWIYGPGTSKARWYYSPHFHFIGFGRIRGSGRFYWRSGWITKNLGIRKSVFGTAFYQLTHAGVSYGGSSRRKHSVTWFGLLSYNKLRYVVKPERSIAICPECKAMLNKVSWIGSGKEPRLRWERDIDKHKLFCWASAEGWVASGLEGYVDPPEAYR